MATQLTQELVRLGQVLAVGALALEQIGDRVESHAVDAHVEPKVAGLEERFLDPRVVVIEVGLM